MSKKIEEIVVVTRLALSGVSCRFSRKTIMLWRRIVMSFEES